nr:immunoglobulin heavy chain junction region [Macaca mulatta]
CTRAPYGSSHFDYW